MLLANRLSASPKVTLALLRDWLTRTAGWLHSSDLSLRADDLNRLLTVLHLLHLEAFAIPDHHSSDTSPGPSFTNEPVSLSLASQGLGQVGCVPIPPSIWISSASGGLLLADARTPPQKASNCPLVQAMLDSLVSAGLVVLHPGLPNAEVFV